MKDFTFPCPEIIQKNPMVSDYNKLAISLLVIELYNYQLNKYDLEQNPKKAHFNLFPRGCMCGFHFSSLLNPSQRFEFGLAFSLSSIVGNAATVAVFVLSMCKPLIFSYSSSSEIIPQCDLLLSLISDVRKNMQFQHTSYSLG